MRRRVITAVAVVAPALFGVAACSSGGAAVDATPQTARLAVHIGLFGGPARPDGRSALSNSPVARVRVVAIDAAGHRWSAITGSDGTAAFSLAPGRYTVVPRYCGGAHHHVSVTRWHTARVQVSCPVP